MKLLGLTGVFLLLMGCEVATTAKTDSDSQTSAVGTEQELKALASGSCSRTSDCLTAGMGVRGCGGPSSYLTFSKWDNILKIFEKLDAYNEKKSKEAAGQIGTCEFLMPPSVSCVSNKCTAQSTNSYDTVALGIVSGEITLNIPRLTNLPMMTFKADRDPSVTYYLKLSNLEYAQKTKLESYRKSTLTVKVRVKIFALQEEGSACEFVSNASCSTRVSVYNVRSLKILSVK